MYILYILNLSKRKMWIVWWKKINTVSL